jgi:ureidoglycolate lyase
VAEIVRIKVALLDDEAFAPFGDLLAAKPRAPDFTGLGSVGWKASFACDGPPELMVYSSRYSGLRFTMLERHFDVTQTFIPLGSVPAVVAVAAPTARDQLPEPGDVRAFLLDGSAGYVLRQGTWHSLDRFPLNPPSAEIVILTARATQRELETVAPEQWRLTQQVDYQATFGVTLELVPEPPEPSGAW